MKNTCIQQLFDDAGFPFLYEKFHYQIYVTGLFDEPKNSYYLERFLSHFHFNETEPLLFDEFSLYYKAFHYSQQKKYLTGLLDQDGEDL
ncbi:hypothetical protein [Bacillus massiliglaciei]|uniref:hypothetical protein n=1 Tax=Bacillus massiliglaciei TaxID=1816693 RepID=UPI000DA61BFC|nr:hypothetical protein [Bacillus massiliglaciei]